MIIKFSIIAFRNLMRYRTRSLLTGLSILLGTTAIILGLSLTDGIIRQTIIGFTGTLVEDVMAFPNGKTKLNGPKGIERSIDDEEKDTLMFFKIFQNQAILNRFREIEKSVNEIKGIDYVTKKVQFIGALFSDTSSVNALIMGMEPEGIRRKTNLQMEEGRYLNDNDRLSLIISKRLPSRRDWSWLRGQKRYGWMES